MVQHVDVEIVQKQEKRKNLFWADVGSGPLRAERRRREARHEKFTR